MIVPTVAVTVLLSALDEASVVVYTPLPLVAPVVPPKALFDPELDKDTA